MFALVMDAPQVSSSLTIHPHTYKDCLGNSKDVGGDGLPACRLTLLSRYNTQAKWKLPSVTVNDSDTEKLCGVYQIGLGEGGSYFSVGLRLDSAYLGIIGRQCTHFSGTSGGSWSKRLGLPSVNRIELSKDKDCYLPVTTIHRKLNISIQSRE